MQPKIIDKIQVGSRVVADGRTYTIVGQRDSLTWEWSHEDGGSGFFVFTPDQVEDGAFIIID